MEEPAVRWLDRDRRDGPAPVFLHIGGPSTGTTYLQGLMAANAETLAAAGYLLPGRTWRDVVLATHDALSFGRRPAADRPGRPGRNDLTAQAGGRWDELAGQMADHRGAATILSMEFLCWAKPAAAERIVASLAGAEVHVVLTVRDTAAVLRSQWQTNCRNGAEVPLRRLIWGLRQAVEKDAPPASRPERMVDRAMGIPRMIDTWAPLVGAARVHVVTVPLRSADPDLLWKRFAGVLGIDAASCDERPEESNPSLGLPSSELMRLLNIELGPVPRTEYLRTMKSLLARDILGERATEERKVSLNRAGHALSARWNERIRSAIGSSGVDLVGDLDDLPVEDPGDDVPVRLEAPSDAELLRAAAWAHSGLTAAIERLEEKIVAARAELERTGPASDDTEDVADHDSEDDHDDDEGNDEGEDEGDDPDDAGLDREAVLERQLGGRAPEVRAALTETVRLVRRAMPLGTELATLRTQATGPRPPA